MTVLKDFLTLGRLGPIALGLTSTDTLTLLGDPDDVSKKSNPLQMTYGSLRLTYLRGTRSREFRLIEIVVSSKDGASVLPDGYALVDIELTGLTERTFRRFMHEVGVMPVHLIDGTSGRSLIFSSGVVVKFVEGKLDEIRLSQRDETNDEPSNFYVDGDRQELKDIQSLFSEAESVLKIGATRSAYLSAWSGLEAVLREKLQATRQSSERLSMQPVALIRELFTEDVLNRVERDVLEHLRQVRNEVAHGISTTHLTKEDVEKVISIGKQILERGQPTLRKLNEVSYIYPVETADTFSILTKSTHTGLLSVFLEDQGVHSTIIEKAIVGDEQYDELTILKNISVLHLNELLGAWKRKYAVQ